MRFSSQLIMKRMNQKPESENLQCKASPLKHIVNELPAFRMKGFDFCHTNPMQKIRLICISNKCRERVGHAVKLCKKERGEEEKQISDSFEGSE